MEVSNPTCPICDTEGAFRIAIQSFFFPTSSNFPSFHRYDNYICGKCNVAFMFPLPSREDLTLFYNTTYRRTNFAVKVTGGHIDVPIEIPWSGISFQRFQTFYDTIMAQSKKNPDVLPEKKDMVVDYGGYQGMFLHALSQVFQAECIVCDLNESGVSFAKKAFDFRNSKVIKDICSEVLDKRPRFVTLIHAFEHLDNPNRFLAHVRENILEKNGYIYIEVPNLYGFPLSDPTHFFTYSTESLRYLMESNGFEVIDIFESGFPQTDGVLQHNRIASLICLAKATGRIVSAPPARDPREIFRAMRRNYREHSMLALKRQFKKCALECMRLGYFFVFSCFLESLPSRFTTKLDMAVKKYGHSIRTRLRGVELNGS